MEWLGAIAGLLFAIPHFVAFVLLWGATSEQELQRARRVSLICAVIVGLEFSIGVTWMTVEEGTSSSAETAYLAVFSFVVASVAFSGLYMLFALFQRGAIPRKNADWPEQYRQERSRRRGFQTTGLLVFLGLLAMVLLG